jgi:hypothetical protein
MPDSTRQRAGPEEGRHHLDLSASSQVLRGNRRGALVHPSARNSNWPYPISRRSLAHTELADIIGSARPIVSRLIAEWTKTQASLPSDEAVLFLLLGLPRSGQVRLGRLAGWQDLTPWQARQYGNCIINCSLDESLCSLLYQLTDAI